MISKTVAAAADVRVGCYPTEKRGPRAQTFRQNDIHTGTFVRSDYWQGEENRIEEEEVSVGGR